MIVIETCPECGHDLLNEVLCTYPPIPKKVCMNCGWSWVGEREEIVRVPFDRKLNCNDNKNSTEEVLTILNNIDGAANSTAPTSIMHTSLSELSAKYNKSKE